MTISLVLFLLALAVYLAATLLYLTDVVRRRAEGGLAGRWTLVAGFLLHLASTVSRYVELGFTPVTNLHESLSFFVLTIVGAYLVFNLRYRLAVLGAFTSALGTIIMAVSALLHRGLPREVSPILNSWLFPVHVALAFLGNGVLALAFGAGVMYLVQERLLKSKNFNALYYRLPSLDALDRFNYASLSSGFVLLTLGIISGSIWAEAAWGSYWSWEPKQTWALATWMLYAAALHARMASGWRGRRAAIFAIVGFLALMFSFLGVNLLFGGPHAFRAFQGG